MENPTELIPDAKDESAMAALMVQQEQQKESPPDEIIHDEPEKPDSKESEKTGEPAKSDADGKGGDAGTKTEPEKKEELPEKKIPSIDEKAEDEDEEDKKFNQEIDKIKLRKGASEKSERALSALKQKAKDERKARKELAKEYETFKKAQSEAKPLTPELSTELEDLRNFRRTIDLENDPQFNEQFTGRIKQYEDSGANLLKEWKVPESAVKYIQDNGGLLKFRSSQELMPPSVLKEGKRVTHEQWWEDFLLPALSSSKREEVGDLLSNLRQLHRQRNDALQTAKTNKETYVKQSAEQTKKAQENWITRVQAHAKVVLPKFGEMAQLKEIPQDATPEVKSAIEKHNARYKKAEGIAQKYITQVTPENLTEAAIKAAYSEVMQDDIKAKDDLIVTKDARIKELEDQIAGIKGAGKTSHRAAPSDSKPEKKEVPEYKLSAEEAMERRMKEME